MSDNKARYTGDKINVEWDGQLCIHITECGKSNGDLFVDKRNPWCQPDLDAVDNVIDIVKRCPTGALTYSAQDSAVTETVETENIIVVSNNGPYFIRSELDFDAEKSNHSGVSFRAALCRCGASKNKPFCDNSHETVGFKDYGAVGEKGEALTATGGKLSISEAENGPIILKGNLVIQNGNGRHAWSGTQIALCRCGASNNKPFCDGSHVAAGFKSTE